MAHPPPHRIRQLVNFWMMKISRAIRFLAFMTTIRLFLTCTVVQISSLVLVEGPLYEEDINFYMSISVQWKEDLILLK